MAEILVVDDSASMRHMVRSTLELHGHNVSESVDGEEGLRLTQEFDYELIITDVNMPKMSGITMTERIRKLTNYKSIPVILLTTESGLDKKLEGRAAGATGWITKPFEPTKLAQTVKKVLS